MGDTKKIEGLGEKLSRFTHDIRNPLYIAKSLIETHLEELQASHTDQPETNSAQTKTEIVLTKSVKELERVLFTLQRLGKVLSQSKKKETTQIEKARVCVKEILSRLMMALRQGGYLDHLMLVEHLPSNLPAVSVNATDLEEIGYNLIMNAAQATMKGGHLTIRTLLIERPAPKVVISFEDTGHGIPNDVLPYIFEPFYSGRKDAGGVGFGLYIVKQLVERNNGTLGVKSELNRGSTFTVSFPAAGKDD